MQIAARDAERAQREAERAHKAAVRRAEQARREEDRARQQLAKAKEAERKQLEKEAAAAHIASMQADVEERNLQLQEVYSEIDSLLEATLDVDDYVDLDKLRVIAEHPPFDRADLERPITPPQPPAPPPEPTPSIPAPPTGLRALFGKKKHAGTVEKAEAAHEAAVQGWQERLTRLEAEHQMALEAHARDEQQRISALEVERARYAKECEAREAEAAEHNAAVDKLAADLGYGVVAAVEEYVSIVLSNSVYPDHFPVRSDFEFDPDHAELRLRVVIPPPDQLPRVKAYRYKKPTDEIIETSLPQKACKDRYAGAVHQVALRTLHEIFEADRRGIIQTLSLEVGTETTHPATGLQSHIPFVVVGSERSAFMEFDLSSVVPLATLEHLGAAISKNPYGLVAVDTSGVRKA
jgi:restriction system protein